MRIAIVTDMIMAVEAVRRVVVNTLGHQLAWIACDGAEAVERCAADTPDLILMDLVMPNMDGVEATRRIMATNPCPIVVVTANVTDNSSKVFEAMEAGALDAVNTPVLESPQAAEGADALRGKIETIRRLLGADRPKRNGDWPEQAGRAAIQHHDSLVAIGASAGGPGALAKVLAQLPADFPAAIVIVQHVDAHFAQGLAKWLDYQTPLSVRLAEEGEHPLAGTVLLAGTDSHLVFASPSRLSYTPYPKDCSYRPSIDVFFKSIERFCDATVIGIVLTGMGRDGAEGLRALRAKGHHTIAQDQSSSAVYGMPQAAAQLEAATEILSLEKIGPRLIDLVSSRTKRHG